MGRVEQEARKRRNKRNIQNAVLATVGVAGILAVAMVAPNIFRALPRIMGDKYKLNYRTKNAIGRLAEKGLIHFTTRNGIRYMEITKKGRNVLYLKEAQTKARKKPPRRWDNRYRIVMFDIPQKRRIIRDRLRGYMREYGFLQLQESVWIYPHDCEEIITLLKTDFQLEKSVLYTVAESIENDGWIKKHFSLSS